MFSLSLSLFHKNIFKKLISLLDFSNWYTNYVLYETEGIFFLRRIIVYAYTNVYSYIFYDMIKYAL